MQAVTYENYGTPEVLRVKEVETPSLQDNEILIKVHAAEVTKADCEMRSFKFQVKWFWLPLRITLGLTKPRRQILGGYFAGQVESVGKDVSKFALGDQVFGTTGTGLGAHAAYLSLPATKTILPKPRNLNFVEAAAVPLGGFNALHFMRKANIKKGDKVLINGAGGSIGIFAVQIAKAMGAEVTAVDSTAKEQMLREIGVDHFIDYTKDDFTESDQTFDVIFSVVMNRSYSKCVNVLKPNGRYLLANPRLIDMLRAVVTSKFTDKTTIFAFAGEKKEELQTLSEMIESGKIRAIVDRIYSFEQAAEAHRRVETEQRLGSTIITNQRQVQT